VPTLPRGTEAVLIFDLLRNLEREASTFINIVVDRYIERRRKEVLAPGSTIDPVKESYRRIFFRLDVPSGVFGYPQRS